MTTAQRLEPAQYNAGVRRAGDPGQWSALSTMDNQGMTWAQYVELCKPLDMSRIAKDPRGNSHLEQWDVRRHLIRIFGFGGWDFEVVSADLVREIQHSSRRRKRDNGV